MNAQPDLASLIGGAADVEYVNMVVAEAEGAA